MFTTQTEVTDIGSVKRSEVEVRTSDSDENFGSCREHQRSEIFEGELEELHTSFLQFAWEAATNINALGMFWVKYSLLWLCDLQLRSLIVSLSAWDFSFVVWNS